MGIKILSMRWLNFQSLTVSKMSDRIFSRKSKGTPSHKKIFQKPIDKQKKRMYNIDTIKQGGN